MPQGVLEPPQGQGQGQKKERSPEPDKPVRGKNDYPDDYLEFWKAYPTSPNMSKLEGFRAWKRLSSEDKSAAIASIPGFLAFCARKPNYEPVYVERYLGQRRFDGYAAASADSDACPVIDFGRGYTAPESTVVAMLKRGTWPGDWGPKPGQPGCRVPERLWPAAASERVQ